MPTISQGSEVTLSLSATDAYQVTVPSGGEAYVDLLSGAPGSPFSSPRLNGKTVLSKVFGPYGVPAQIKVRATSGSVTYANYAPNAPVTYNPTTGNLEANESPVSGAGNAQQGRDGLQAPVEHISSTAALSATSTIRITPTGTYRTARISWVNSSASGSAKLNIAANCGNDVEGLVASQSALQRDAQMTMGDALILASPTPITSLNFSSDGAITANTHRLVVTFGA